MSAPINLDLDFEDYIPSGETTQVDDTGQSSSSGTVIRIPDVRQQSIIRNIRNPSTVPQTAGGSILNLLQGASTKSEISDEALRQLSWASGGTQQQHQRTNASAGGWGINYLSKFFDVTTSDVLERILWSALPVRRKGLALGGPNDDHLNEPLAGPANPILADGDSQFGALHNSYSYMERFIQSRPDLYGPFWVSTTLIFAVAIFSNIVGFLEHKFQSERTVNMSNQASSINESAETVIHKLSVDMDDWHYSMDEINTMTSVILIYVTLLPTFIWFVFWFRGCGKYYTLMETICAYGYSLSVYIPMSALLMIQYPLIRYFAMTLASLASGSVLMLSFLPVARSDPSPASSKTLLLLIPICHSGLSYIIHRIMLQ